MDVTDPVTTTNKQADAGKANSVQAPVGADLDANNDPQEAPLLEEIEAVEAAMSQAPDAGAAAAATAAAKAAEKAAAEKAAADKAAAEKAAAEKAAAEKAAAYVFSNCKLERGFLNLYVF